MATFHYPKFLLTYESRTANPMPQFGQGAATSIHGTEATLVVRRGGCWLVPNAKSTVEPLTFENDKEMNAMNEPHWKNFIDCITVAREADQRHRDLRPLIDGLHSRQPVDALSRHWLDWDEKNWTVKQENVKPMLKAKYRAPWKLSV
jgi:hypothetical protein